MSDRTPASVGLKNMLRSWIPPFGILFGLLAFSFAWVLMFWAALDPTQGVGISFRFKLARIHTLAIGFFTVTALSVLFHVMPAFTGTPWENERGARKTLPFLALGVMGMIGFFLSGNARFWVWGFPLAAGSILVWAGLFFNSLLKGLLHRRQARSPLAIFLFPAGFLVIAAILGVSMGISLVIPSSSEWIYSSGIPIHMVAGLLGWLTSLLWIVSARTRLPILGARSPQTAWLFVSIGLLSSGTLLFILGRLSSEAVLQKTGGILAGAGTLVYLAESLQILRRASPAHPVFLAWWATGVLGLSGSLVAGAIFLFTDEPRAPDLFVYLLLSGWIQPFLLGHLHQIGVRLLATLVRGAEDQTPPSRLLSNKHAWGFWWLTVLGFLAGLGGIVTGSRLLFGLGGILGILASCLLADHIVRMIKRCRTLPAAKTSPVPLIRFPHP